jgi:3-hexulose-6-phosphate synthase/6-phospho-3-hexuloisomerase
MAAKLQVALDFLEWSRAIRAAREAVAGGAEILEVGTPLLKSEGLDTIRKLRAEFPKVTLVADTKVMDAGRMEMEAAAKAGADIATVMGAASATTIRECVETARNYGIRVCVDLLGVENHVARATEAQEWGADLVSVHCPIDDQMAGLDPFEKLREVRSAVSLQVAVAGGINSITASKAVESGADIVIVGGAITKSEDAAEATRTILRAVVEEVSIASGLFRRVHADEIRSALDQVSTPNLSDAMHRSGELAGLLPVLPGLKMVGPAVTVRTYPGDWAKPVEAIEHASPGDVIVIDAGGAPPAVWGELASESCMQMEVSGVVVDGAVRDVDTIRNLRFPCFTRHVTPTAWEPKGFGEIGVPIKVGGRLVNPGDWIVGDDSGVVVVPKSRAAEIANRAMDVLERENRLREEIRRKSTLSEVAELLRWEKK